jgi:hypothetical protein
MVMVAAFVRSRLVAYAHGNANSKLSRQLAGPTRRDTANAATAQVTRDTARPGSARLIRLSPGFDDHIRSRNHW